MINLVIEILSRREFAVRESVDPIGKLGSIGRNGFIQAGVFVSRCHRIGLLEVSAGVRIACRTRAAGLRQPVVARLSTQPSRAIGHPDRRGSLRLHFFSVVRSRVSGC